MSFGDVYRNKRVLLTGHTGFKGAWLAEWLLSLGAEVTGFALEPPTVPAIFSQLGLEKRLNNVVGDIRDLSALCDAFDQCRPDFVFHLAAQPLVRLSYSQPVETFAVNVSGTVHLLEAVRRSQRQCTVVCITTDKCYQNQEWVHSYREDDPMGGYDPYSASKGAAELIIASYRQSFFSSSESPVRLASARAGNVVGGGDWALDRIVPDCIRALQRGDRIYIRNRTATRPWQHVLEPLSGYLHLGASIRSASLDSRAPNLEDLCGAFNFGPAVTSNRSVGELVDEVIRHWPGRWEDKTDSTAVHEARLLNLATDKAFHHLKWQPVWNFERTIAETVGWYRQCAGNPMLVRDFTAGQIRAYTADAGALGVAWAS